MKRRAFLSYGLLFLGSCTFTRTATPEPASVNRLDKLRFAVTDLSGNNELEQDFGTFRQALEDVIGVPVDFYPVDNYLAAAPAFLANELDLAMAGPSEYLLLRARAKAVPIIGITRPNYYSMIMTLRDKGINSVTDLKGKKIAMRTEGSTAGHIFPMKLLLDAGLSPNDVEILMFGDDSLPALLDGRVDAWAESYVRYVQFSQEYGIDENTIKILAEGEDLPPDVFMVNPNLDEAFVRDLRSQMLANKDNLMTALLASEANQKYQNSRFTSVEDSDYQILRDVYSAIGQRSAIE